MWVPDSVSRARAVSSVRSGGRVPGMVVRREMAMVVKMPPLFGV